MDYIVHGVAKSQTRLNDFHFTLPLNTAKENYWQSQKDSLTKCGKIFASGMTDKGVLAKLFIYNSSYNSASTEPQFEDFFKINFSNISFISGHYLRSEKWSISCHRNKQGCHSHQWFRPSICEFLSLEGAREKHHLWTSSHQAATTPSGEQN